MKRRLISLPIWRLATNLLLLVSLLLICAGCSANNQAQAAREKSTNESAISVSGAFALYPLMVTWAEAYSTQFPQIRIDVSAGGAGKGMADTLGGVVDIGMISRAIRQEEEAQGAISFAVARDAVFPVANAANPALPVLMTHGIPASAFSAVYIDGSLTTWGALSNQAQNSNEIHLYTRSDACGAAEVWASFLGYKQEDLQGIGVFGDPGILEAVIKDPLGLGYNNLNYIFDPQSGKPVSGAVVLPVDFNGNGQADPEEIFTNRTQAQEAIASGRYPSPPARTLYLATRGLPNGQVQDFLNWILTDGQVYVEQAGYIALPAADLETERAKLQP